MIKSNILLVPLKSEDREQFIKDNQWAFLYGATEEFGMRDLHFESEGEIISRETIENSIDMPDAESYRILLSGKKVGGMVLLIDKKNHRGELLLLFIDPKYHSKGIGYSAWMAVEAMYPEIKVWGTCTPYFEKRNIHFYVNLCGFHIVEFFCAFHHSPNDASFSDHQNENEDEDRDGNDEMVRFEKVIS